MDVNVEQISSIDSESAQNYALKVLKTDKEYGKVDGYKYAVKKMGADNNVIKLKKNLLS